MGTILKATPQRINRFLSAALGVRITRAQRPSSIVGSDDERVSQIMAAKNVFNVKVVGLSGPQSTPAPITVGGLLPCSAHGL